MDREPLYQRLERLMRSRRGVAVLAALLAGAVCVEPIVLFIWQRNSTALVWGASTVVLLGIEVFVVLMIRRRMVRKARSLTATRLRRPTGWRVLDEAVAAYEIRTGRAAPQTGLLRRSHVGDVVDAELTYVRAADLASPRMSLRGVLDSRRDDLPMLLFTETMLDSFSAEQLLAVIAHLMARGTVLREQKGPFGNGAREADSRALLLTHDHASLLRALEKCTRTEKTLPPAFGVVKFSDVDLQSRIRLTNKPAPEWERRDRIAELRRHLGPAGLDVPQNDLGSHT